MTSAFAGGRYVSERVLGRGGMATVFLAHDRELDRPVALKVLSAPLAADDEFARRFRREAQTAARLAHPNIVQVFDTGEEDDRLFIVMEYVDGEGLDRHVAPGGGLAPDRVIDLGEQACAALEYAHEQGVVHRDVKPANLLLRRDGLLKITDFGIARPENGTELTQAGTVLGTLAYLAPEQARGEPATRRSDIYALGVVLYELFTGEPPHRIDNLAQLAAQREQPVRPVRELAPAVPEEAEAAVMRSLARNPRYRPESAAELAGELRGAPAPGPTTAPTVPVRPSQARSHRRRADRRDFRLARGTRAVAIAGALAAALIAVVLVAAGGGNGDAGDTPERVERVRPAADPAEQARNLEEWIRRHTAGGD